MYAMKLCYDIYIYKHTRVVGIKLRSCQTKCTLLRKLVRTARNVASVSDTRLSI